MQIAAAREYAAQFGDRDLIVLSDMNVSGRKGRDKRPDFARLLDAIEADQVSAVYSYSLSRLSRSVRDLLALAELCRVHKVPIRLARDADPDPLSASGRMVLGVLAVIAQFEADLASERAFDVVATRRARGDHLGGEFHPETAAVVEAYREARTVAGTVRLLMERGVLTRNGNALWYPSSVRVIVQRAAPDLLPVTRRPGVKHSAPFTFYRLLLCHCGTTLTGVREHRKGKVYTSYLCSRGRYAHREKSYITERVIEEWAVREMSRLRPPVDLVAVREENEAATADLSARLERLRVGFLEGLWTEAEMRAEKADIDTTLTRLDLAGRAVRIPAFSWDHEPRDLNLALRALWEHVELGPDLRPIRAQWLVPERWLGPAAP